MSLLSIFDSALLFLVSVIESIGYFGIFIGMFIESTPFPLPSELVMIPAGMAVAHGKMNFLLVVIFGTLGNIFGAIPCYYIARIYGRAAVVKFGKYFFIKSEFVVKVENYFNNHGNISVFIGRLILGFRHFISLAAGIAKMNFSLFCLYTSLGSLIWTTILVTLGYYIGHNEELIKQYLHNIILACIAFCTILLLMYAFLKKRKAGRC